MTLYEVNEASTLIQEAAHEDANIIFGAVIDERDAEGEVRVTVIATGLDDGRIGAAATCPERDRRDRATELGNVRPLRREASIEAREPMPALEVEPEIAPPPAATPGAQRAAAGAARRILALRGRARRAGLPAPQEAAEDEADRDQPAFLRRSAD